jgi:hypothetical protein
MKLFFSFFLIFSLILPDLVIAKDPIERMFGMNGRQKKRESKKYGCFDFSKPVKLAKPQGKTNYYRRTPKHKSSNNYGSDGSFSDCKEEVMKAKLDVVADMKEVNEDIEKILDRKLDKANNIVEEIDKDQQQLKHKKNNIEDHQSNVYDRKTNHIERKDTSKYRFTLMCRLFHLRESNYCIRKFTQTNSGIERAGKYKKKKAQWVKDIKSNRISSLKDNRSDRDDAFEKRTSKIDNEINELELTKVTKEEEKLIELLGPVHDEMLVAYLEQHPEKKNLSEDEQLEKMYDDEKFAKKYLENKLPDLNPLLAERNKLKETIKNMDKVADQVCRKEQMACPLAKDNFKNNPNEETLKEMLGVVGTIYYTDKNYETSYMENLTVDNYEKMIDKHGKYITNDSYKDKLKENYEQSVDAIKQMKKNTNLKEGQKPERVQAACGNCKDLDSVKEKLSRTSDPKERESLTKLFTMVGCPAPKVSDVSCDEQVKKILVDNNIGATGGKLEGENGAIADFLKDPENKLARFELAFEQVKSAEEKIYDSKDKKKFTTAQCGSCQPLKNELDKFSDEAVEEVETASVDSEGVTTYSKTPVGYRTIKADISQDDLKKFEAIKSVALKQNCVKPNDYRDERKETPSCAEKQKFFVDFINANPNPKNVSIADDNLYKEKLADLKKFQSDNSVQCCEGIVGDLSSEIKGKKLDITYLSNESTKLAVAKSMECLKCGGDKDKIPSPARYLADNPHIDCAFYKNLIEGKTGSIHGLLKGDNSAYTVDEFKQNEIFTCKDGPKKSLIDNNRDWDRIEYSEDGKYGIFSDLDMQCYVNPTTGLTTNLTCCNLKPDSQEFKDFQAQLTSHKDEFSKAQYGSKMNDYFKQDVKKLSPQTFCKDVYANYKDNKRNEDAQGMQICEDYKGQEYKTVSPKYHLEGETQVDGENSKVNAVK